MPKLPGVNHQAAIRALEKAGFQIIREGKQVVYPSPAIAWEGYRRRPSVELGR